MTESVVEQCAIISEEIYNILGNGRRETIYQNAMAVELMKRNNVVTEGKNCVVVGRSTIVGSPLSILLGRNSNPGNCTVTLAHSRTENLTELCKSADIIIAAIGRPEFITAAMVKDGAVIIDVGTTRVDNPERARGWSLKGDV